MRLIEARFAWRENSVGALVELVDDDEVPEVLVDEELRSRVHDLGHRLEEQGLTIDQFLGATGRDAEALLAELRLDALRGVKADLALRALADAEDIQVDDAELDEQLATSAERLEMTPSVLRGQLDRSGRIGEVRSEQRKAKALTWLLDHVQLVDEDGNPTSRDDLRVDPGDDDGATNRRFPWTVSNARPRRPQEHRPDVRRRRRRRTPALFTTTWSPPSSSRRTAVSGPTTCIRGS